MRIGRTLAPAGYRVPVRDVARAAVRLASTGGAARNLERDVARRLGVPHVFAVNSGKAALAIVLRALHARTGRTRVILPAYTCYSVPSAILKAGLVPVPCDLAPGSFDYDTGALQRMLQPDVLCVLAIDLFGIPSDTHALRGLCEPVGAFVVEDAAQAMGMDYDGAPAGTRGDVGFFSLGRGKNVTCGAGGVIVTAREDVADAVAGQITQLLPARPGRGARALLEISATSTLIVPALYWLPAGVPWLRLGETIFYEDFPVERLTDVQALVIEDWSARLAALNTVRQDHTAFYAERLEGAVPAAARHLPLLRFPVLVDDEAARRELLTRGRALGISHMYPASVAAIPQVARVLTCRRFPEAERIARSLVTLPTHPLVTARDRARVCDLVAPALEARELGSG